LLKRNFYRGNYEKINEFLSNSDWSVISPEGCDDINLAYSRFTNIIYKSIDKFIPFYNSSPKLSLPTNITLLRKTKTLLYPVIKANDSAKTVYKELDKLYRRAVSNHIYKKEQRILCSNNKKMFYGYINQKLRSNRSLPPLLDHQNEIVMDPRQKAELLNTQFSKVFINDNGKNPDLKYPLQPNILPMNGITITPSIVDNAITRLKNQVSRTPDNIPAYYIKKAKSSLIKPITEIFNLSMKLGKVPDIWKQAVVTPIYKKGLRNKPENYRQVSLIDTGILSDFRIYYSY
jgi:hypothetical protein